MRRHIAFRQTTACAPQFADGHVSIRFEVGSTCDAAGRWTPDAAALGETVSGPMTGVGRTGPLAVTLAVGAYLRPGAACRFFDLPVSELVDGAVPGPDVWGARWRDASSELADLDDAARIERLESILLARRRDGRRRAESLDLGAVAACVLRTSGRVTVEGLARAAGVSRQQLARAFRQSIGVGPKLYGRLARFQAVLVHAGTGRRVDWAGAALDLGFADQSHLIAECRRFGGLTPRALADRDWFHPFIERAKRRLHGRA
jgi:AraC-like DNA-binding protein